MDLQVNLELLKVIIYTSGDGEEDAIFPVCVLILMFDSFRDLFEFL